MFLCHVGKVVSYCHMIIIVKYSSVSDIRSKTPIIIIPAAATSVVTMYNVCDLLEDYRWVWFLLL